MSIASASGVIEALRRRPGKTVGGGRCVMFIAARRGEGVSTLALAAAKSAGPGTAYAVDLDLRRNGLARAFAAEGAMLGPRASGRINGALFFRTVYPKGVIGSVRELFFYQRIGRSRLYAGVFDNSALVDGSNVAISNTPDYWDAARASGATVIVDAPALERSPIGLRIAQHMDGVVLVVGADAGAAPAAMAARTEILAAGGEIIGLAYTHALGSAVAIDRMLRQAG